MKKVFLPAVLLASVFLFASGGYCARMCVQTKSIKGRTNVRQAPSLKGKIIWQVFRNTPLEIIASEGEWYQVQDYAGYTGWVHSPLLSPMQCVITTSDTAFVYRDTDENSYREWEVDKEYPFFVVSVKGDWVKINDWDGTVGWMKKSDLWGYR